jgi:hypothetical protein
MTYSSPIRRPFSSAMRVGVRRRSRRLPSAIVGDGVGGRRSSSAAVGVCLRVGVGVSVGERKTCADFWRSTRRSTLEE